MSIRLEKCRHWTDEHTDNEKALRETQTLRVGCSKAKPKIFASP